MDLKQKILLGALFMEMMMFSKVHKIEPNKVIDFYLNQNGIAKKHKDNIDKIKSAILNDAKIYKILAISSSLNAVKAMISIITDDEKKSLELLYKHYLDKSGVRQLIFSQSLICIGCQKNYATDRSTMDHFLPSSNYPNFYVLPWNLVPTCGDSNRIKNDVVPITKDDNLPHPYFNLLMFKKNWLKIVISQNKPLKYYFSFDDKLRQSERKMILNHLVAYKLENVFVSHISTLFAEHDEDFREIFEREGSQNLKSYIDTLKNESYISPGRKKKYLPINIEHTFLSALSESNWFSSNYYI